MRAIFGLLLIMFGLAMAVVWMPEQDSERQLAVVTDIATQGIRKTSDSAERSGRTFSPGTPLLTATDRAEPVMPQHIVAVTRAVSLPTATSPEALSREQVQALTMANAATTSSIITGTVTGSSVLAPAAPPSPTLGQLEKPAPTRSTVTVEMSRHELVRNIQRELKRVGCYAGDVDGDWGTGSRRAMSTFTDRVNATLPIDQPDFILLTLVQNHQGVACTRSCPSGQSLSAAGRCLPNAVVAQQRRAPRSQDDAAVPVGGNATSAVDTSRNARIAHAAPTMGTERGSDAASLGAGIVSNGIASAAATPPAATVLPGRMAVGGPQGGSGAYLVQPQPGMPARAAVGALEQPAVTEPPRTRSASPATARRDRGRRAASASRAPGPAYRYGYAPPVFGYRAPRVLQPRFFAAAPRAARSGRWTATFFGGP